MSVDHPRVSNGAELKRLRARIGRLAEEKSYLQLMIHLLERVNPLSGIEGMVTAMLTGIVETIGGTNIRLWYRWGEEFRYHDFFGASRAIPAIDDPLAAHAFAEGQFMEEDRDPHDALLIDGVVPGAWTWVFPLRVGDERLGVIKLENLHLSTARLRDYLPIFFSHVALMLSNEIRRLLSRRAEAELLAMSAELDRYFNNALDLFCISDSEGRFRKLNPQWERTLGYPVAEMQGRRFIEFVHPDDVTATMAIVDLLKRKIPVHHFTNRYRHKDGSYRWIEWTAHPDDGLVYAAAHDVTARVQAEEQMHLAASVFANSQEGIVITDANNRIVDVNEAFSRLTGYARDEVVGHDPKLLASGRHDAAFYREMWRALRERSAWRGEIWNRRKSGDIYPELLHINVIRGEAGKVVNYVAVFSDISYIKAHEAELEHVAHYDNLTALPNRLLLSDRLEQAVARARSGGHALAICYLDLDGFKPVNDSFGHDVGDRLLVEITKRLKAELRGDDTLARLGGDEFILLLNEIEYGEALSGLLDRVLHRVAEPMQLDDRAVAVSASVGITLFPQDGTDPDTLLRHADQAMYQAKQGGRNRYHFYDPEQDRQIAQRQATLQRLTAALRGNEFLLYFQPKVHLTEGRVIGAEALLRWRDPERGIIAPGEFLHFILGTELEVELGQWVVETALQQLSAWNAIGVALEVSINVSPAQLQQSDFAEQIAAALARHPQVASHQLELEILESSAISDLEHASRNLATCVSLGVRFALDDFGTGYSSLAYFRRLPIGTLKIDQAFVRDMLDDPDDLSIVESVIRLAHAFRRPVLAEGVESLEHAAMLVHLGCHMGQGFGIARPMPADQFVSWIEQWRHEQEWHNLKAELVKPNDVVLGVAGVSHRRWVAAIEHHVRAGDGETLKVLARKECRFGRWYRGIGFSRYGHLPAYAALDPPHDRIHRLTQRLQSLIAAGHRDAAVARLPELHVLSDEVIAALTRLMAACKEPGDEAREVE